MRPVLKTDAPVLLAVVLVGTIMAACGGAAPIGSTAVSTGPSRPGPTIEPIGSTTPGTGTPAPTVAASADPAPTGGAGQSVAAGQPPSAALAADGGDPVVGQLGTYTWLDGGSDSPWLPGTTIAVGA